MTALEQSEHAMHRLIMARIAGNPRTIQYWLTRVDYYTELVLQEKIKEGRKMRKLISKYEGTCSKCSIDLAIGQEIMYEKTTGVFCPGCEPTDPEEIRTYRQAKLDRKSDRRQEWADSAIKQADALDKSLDTYKDWNFITQPILVGHHSERGHRNLLKRIHGRMDKEMELRKKAENHLNHVGVKATVKGDAETARQARRDTVRAKIAIGMKVDTAIYGTGIVKKINKKTATISNCGCSQTYEVAVDLSFITPVTP